MDVVTSILNQIHLIVLPLKLMLCCINIVILAKTYVVIEKIVICHMTHRS
jgi:hypothetical protein